MFGAGANRWTLTWMWWHHLVLGGTRCANHLVYLHRHGMQCDRHGIYPSLFVVMAISNASSWLVFSDLTFASMSTCRASLAIPRMNWSLIYMWDRS